MCNFLTVLKRKSGRPYDSDDDEAEDSPEQTTMLKGVKLRRCGFCGIQVRTTT